MVFVTNHLKLAAATIHYRGRKLAWQEVEQRPVNTEPVAQKPGKPHPRAIVQAANHPWRKRYQDMKPWGPPATSVPSRASVASPSAPP